MTETTRSPHPTDRTLLRLGMLLVALLVVMATLDLLRGTGGRAWLVGTRGAVARLDAGS